MYLKSSNLKRLSCKSDAGISLMPHPLNASSLMYRNLARSNKSKFKYTRVRAKGEKMNGER